MKIMIVTENGTLVDEVFSEDIGDLSKSMARTAFIEELKEMIERAENVEAKENE